MPILNKYDTKHKSFIKMQKRQQELQDELDKIPLRELKTPYQKGWLITYRLRDDISRRPDADLILQVLEAGWQKEVYVKDLEAVKAVRQGFTKYVSKRKDKDGNFISVDLRPQRKLVDKKKYEEFPERVKTFFYLDTTHEAYIKYNREYFYGVLPAYYLELRVRPYMVTHDRIKGGELEEEYEFLRDKLQEYWREYFGYRRYPRGSRRREERDQIRKFMNGDKDDILLGRKEKYDYD